MQPTLFGSNIVRLLQAQGKRQKDLASFCEVSGATVSDWISGKTKQVEGRHLLATATFFQVDANDLWHSEIDASPHQVREGDTPDVGWPTKVVLKSVPVHGVIQSTTEVLLSPKEGSANTLVEKNAMYSTNIKDAYALRIAGDTYRPRFKPGESIICSGSKGIEPGQEVFVKLRSGRALVRVFDWRRAGMVQLSCVNERGSPQTFDDSDIEILHRIIGAVQSDMHY